MRNFRFYIQSTTLLVMAVAAMLSFQNCGPSFQAVKIGNTSNGSAAFGGQRATVLSSAAQLNLRDAENSIPAAAGDAPNQQARSRGSCVIRGGAGLYLSRIDLTDQSTCTNRCNSFASSNPNRYCLWKGSKFFGDPQQLCSVQGGAHVMLSSLPLATEAQCHATCDQFASSNPYRICDWGDDRFLQPAAASECKIIGGAGKMLLNPSVFSNENDCRSLCDTFSSSVYRTCLYGGSAFVAPRAESRCDLWGGAGKALRPAFFGTLSDCQSSCSSFSTNPNRICWYGTARLQ